MKSFKHHIKYILIFTLSSILISPNSYASSGIDRCYIKECLCEVRAGKPPSALDKSVSTSRIFSIFFEENKFALTEANSSGLDRFLNKFKNTKIKASIIGYTDGCGSHDHNKQLSYNRASSVYRLIKAKYPSAYLKKISSGEKSLTHKASARRVDVIVHTNNRLTTAIEKIPSDYYLIDASGSMWSSYRGWNSVINASVKPKSRIFLSITRSCPPGSYMSQVSPGGGTEIWWSYWNLISKMKPGESLLIISDFQSQVPLSQKEAVWFRERVAKAKIIVRSIIP